MVKGTWICVPIGFPEAVFITDVDATVVDPTTGDTIVSCKHVTASELVRDGLRIAKLLKIFIGKVPIP